MVAKNEMCYTDCVDKVIDHAMTKLFQLAEYICGRRPLNHDEPAASVSAPAEPSIRFSNEDKLVEGELFNLKDGQC